MPVAAGKPYAYFACSGLSLTTRGPSGTWYSFKQGEPVAVREAVDANKFAGQWDVLYMCDAQGSPIPTHPDDLRARGGDDAPLSFVRFDPPGTITSQDVIRPPSPEPVAPREPAPKSITEVRPNQEPRFLAENPVESQPVVTEPADDLDADPEVQAMEAKRVSRKTAKAGKKTRGRR